MKRLLFCGLLFQSIVLAQEPILTQIEHSGCITWTNVANSNALYRVEWASSPVGPWNFSVDSFGGGEFRAISGGTNTQFSVDVPMVFRVRMITNTPPLGMVLIPGGTFQMGNHFPAEADSDQLPVHDVEVNSFWISRTEVTQSEWNRVLKWGMANGYQFSNTNSFVEPDTDVPVSYRSWNDVAKWCNAKSEMEGLQTVYWIPDGAFAWPFKTGETNTVEYWNDVGGYRMPTEAEWEYAARGGLTGKRFPWGDTIGHAQANYDSTDLYAYDISITRGHHPAFTNFTFDFAPVAQLAPNGYGLYDMAGNVREMCSDRYASNYYSWGGANTNPSGPSGILYSNRVRRGGSAGHNASIARVAVRMYAGPTDLFLDTFRIVIPQF